MTSHQDVRSGHERGDADRVLNGVTPTSLEIVLNLGVRPCPSDARMCFDRIPYCVPGFGFSCGRFAADGSQNNHRIADVMWHSWLYLKDVEENTGKSSFNSGIDWDGRINVDVLSLQ